MSKNSVIIITRSDDNDSVKMVSEQLVKMNAEPFRLDSDYYPSELFLSTKPGEPPRVRIDGESRSLDTLAGCWYRRYFAGGRLPTELGANREVCVHEARRTLYGSIASLGCFQMDKLVHVREADHKELQLQRAQGHGMVVPRTLFSNDAQDVKDFYDQEKGEIITKMQSSFAVYPNGEEEVVFTTKVKPEQLDELENLRYCPMIFQEFLPKKLDIRCTVVGDRLFTAAIDSQQSKLTEVDWRRDGARTLEDWFPYDLPKETEQALLRLVSDFGLNYAAADFVLTRDDRLVFLEINAGGEWFWLRTHVGLAIDQAIAEVLLGKATRREA